MKKINIVVEVSGGLVQNVYSDDPEIVVEVVDFDNAEESDTVDEDQERLDDLTKTMTVVW